MRLYVPTRTWLGGRTQDARPGVGVLIRGRRVVEAGDADELRRSARVQELHELPNTLITPGLMNWHCHLELSAMPRPPAPRPGGAGFVDWLLEVMAGGPKSGTEAAEAARAGAEACLRHGVTTIHDITRHPREVRRALAGLPLKVVSYAEVTGMASRRGRADTMLAAACDTPLAPNLTFGLAPHAPYSTEIDAYKKCCRLSIAHGWPVTTHLAEVPEEREFLVHHTGPFKRLWDTLRGWTDDVPRFLKRPADEQRFYFWFASEAGVDTALLVHLNDASEEDRVEFTMLTPASVHCPRTHAYFERDPDAFRRGNDLLQWKLGTDSTASSGDLDLLQDLRLIRRTQPQLTAPEIWEMAVEEESEPSALAWPATTPDPLNELLASPTP